MGQPDAILQICPPYLFEKLPEPTVGLFFTETCPLPDSWALYCSNLDHIIHPSKEQGRWCALNNNYLVKDSIVNLPAKDKIYYNKEHQQPKWMGHETFKFYTIGENNERKNLHGIIKSFFSAFRAADPVELIIKTNSPINVLDIAEKCNLVDFPSVRVISSFMSESELCSLHQHSNCFVQASYSEGYSIPCFDALFFGKTPIAPDSGGYREFLNTFNSFQVDTREEYVYNGGQVHAELFDCNKVWFSPNLKTLSDKMVLAYKNMESRRALSGSRFAVYDKFQPLTIGKKLLEVLSNV